MKKETRKMQAIVETVFDVCYLIGVVVVGILLVVKGNKQPIVRKFGIMAIVLGLGDSFHLVPRMLALWSGDGLAAHAVSLGIGKFITSITMTIFYVILYYIWRERYQIKRRNLLTGIIWACAVLRIGICLFPQNQWLVYNPPILWGILRNIPFAIMGIAIIVIFAQEVKKHNDKVFRFMPLAIILSFAFYIPVVLFAEQIPLIGMLMMPKTLAYVWIVIMGWQLYKNPVLKG